MENLSATLIKSIIKKRLPNSHKGTYGHALLIAGNLGKMGAALIAAKACVRSGVGLVTVNVPFMEQLTIQVSVPEAMLHFRESFSRNYESFSAIGIGPGIGKNSLEKKVLKEIIKYSDNPIVLDADALNIIADAKKILNKIPPWSLRGQLSCPQSLGLLVARRTTQRHSASLEHRYDQGRADLHR